MYRYTPLYEVYMWLWLTASLWRTYIKTILRLFNWDRKQSEARWQRCQINRRCHNCELEGFIENVGICPSGLAEALRRIQWEWEGKNRKTRLPGWDKYRKTSTHTHIYTLVHTHMFTHMWNKQIRPSFKRLMVQVRLQTALLKDSGSPGCTVCRVNGGRNIKGLAFTSSPSSQPPPYIQYSSLAFHYIMKGFIFDCFCDGGSLTINTEIILCSWNRKTERKSVGDGRTLMSTDE